MTKLCFVLALASVLGCGSGSDVSPDAPMVDASGTSTIAMRTTPFDLAPGGETYHCWYFKPDLAPGLAIDGFHPVTSEGVHHLAFFFDAGGTAQPDSECEAFGPWSLLWGAGVGTGDAMFPPGIAMPARTDGAYVLQVHMLNASDQPLAITAGVDMLLTAPGTTYTRAGVFLEGNTSFTVPANTTNYTVTTDCTGKLPDGAQLVGLFPHMHQLGVRFQAELVQSAQTIYDKPWQFDAQTLTMFEPQPAWPTTTTLEQRCIYTNSTASPVSFGLHTSDEMCFGAFYYTPAVTDEIDCIAN